MWQYLKALALGARAVFLGRPVLWGLAHSGEDGVTNVLKLINDEFVLAMKLAGCIQLEVRVIAAKPLIMCDTLSFFFRISSQALFVQLYHSRVNYNLR